MHKRARKAYFVTFTIVFNYVKLYYLSKLFGRSYWDNRISKLHERSAKKAKKTLLELKGLFIKAGQVISILSNVLPEEFRKHLEELQDQLPPRPYEEVKNTIETEFNKPIDQVFSLFNQEALASASIGQTHRAKLHDGTDVVVKVQHFDMEKIAATDLTVIKSIVKIYAYFFNIKGANHMYTQVKAMIEDELDYVHEALAMKRIGKNLSSDPDIIVPKVFDDYTHKKVITSAYAEGAKISDIKQLDEWGIDRIKLAKRFVQMYCKMIFEDDIFHADPHPGNILITKTGKIVLLDFGAVTHINNDMKTGLPELAMAISKNDTHGIVRAMRKMGFLGSSDNAEKLAKKIIKIIQDFLHNEIQIESLNFEGVTVNPDSKIISKLLQAVNLREISNVVEIPKDWILLQRVLVLVLGVSNQLDPKMNLKEVIQPYFKKILFKQKGGVKSFVFETIKNQFTTLLSMPNDIKNTLQKVNDGEIEVRSDYLEKQLKITSNILQQIVFVLLTVAAVYFANYFYENGNTSAYTYAKWFGVVFFGFFLRYFIWRKK